MTHQRVAYMSRHEALVWLPDALRDAGINVVELTGWADNQPGYYWTDQHDRHHGFLGKPNGWVWHHTASLGYTPFVKNAAGQTKANLWLGLARGNRLYAFGNGPPTVVFASGGPANYSAGAGRRAVLDDFVAKDRQFNGPQRLPDTPGFYGNRYYGATELVHPGDGSACHQGVWEMQAHIAAIMSAHWGWSAYRHIGHLDHTRRKIDQRFDQGAPYTIGLMQRMVLAPPPPPPEADDMNYRKMIDMWGPVGLEKLKQAGRWDGTVAWYFNGGSDAEAGANQNLVEHIMVNDALLTIDEGSDGGGDLSRGDSVTLN